MSENAVGTGPRSPARILMRMASSYCLDVRAALVAAIMATFPDASGGQSPSTSLVVRGVVLDSTRQPISYALVAVNRNDGRITNDSGRFVIALREAGPITLIARRVGFRPVELTFEAVPDSTIAIVLYPLAASLEKVRVEAHATVRSLELAGFYERMGYRLKGSLGGYFITPEDIEKRPVTRASQLLHELPSIKVMPSGTTSVVLGRNNCPMTVYLNRVRLNGLRGTGPAAFDDLVSPSNLAGIEVYPSRATAPIEYVTAGSRCGVILIWTK